MPTNENENNMKSNYGYLFLLLTYYTCCAINNAELESIARICPKLDSFLRASYIKGAGQKNQIISLEKTLISPSIVLKSRT
ncbi:7493_t:CDS:1, partial [Racocetra persica]